MIWLEIDFIADIEVHAASYVFDHEAIASRLCILEIDVPHIRAGHILLVGLIPG